MAGRAHRPAQSVLMPCGLVLSTVVITASFDLQGSFTDSTLTHRLVAPSPWRASGRLRRDPQMRTVRIGCMPRAGADEWVHYYVAKGAADLNSRFIGRLTH